ncbi:hypothetical protein BH24ACI5_BH24ACI5_21100 [soil metagenome]
MPRAFQRLWLLWIPLVWFISFPWIGFTFEPQWDRVNLIPLTDPGDRPRDIAANLLLFVPFGFSVGRRRTPARALARAAGLAAVVSISAEAMQLFSTARYPSATDVAAAILGSLAGAVSTIYLRPSSRPATWTD